jgi:peptidoglycan/xylan/chitin deacetylase (PgdA/CDA1 family)
MANSPLSVVKPVVISALHHLGVLKMWRYRQKHELIILMYHRFSLDSEPFKLNAVVFERQLAFLAKKYNIIAFPDLLEFYQGKAELPDNPLIITIDDGYYDNYSIAYPLLRKYDISATIFLATDFVSRNAWLWSNRLEYILKHSARPSFNFSIMGEEFTFDVDTFSGWHCSQLTIFNTLRHLGDEKEAILDELAGLLQVDVPEEVTEEFKSLDWQNIREMQENRVFFGSHTCSHPILSSLTRERVYRELMESKTEIEGELDTAVDVICYPNGQPEDISQSVQSIAQECGYMAGVSTILARNDPPTTNRFSLNRSSLSVCNDAHMAAILARLPAG